MYAKEFPERKAGKEMRLWSGLRLSAVNDEETGDR